MDRKERLLRFPELLRTVPVSRTTLWRMMRDGKFPRPIKISGHTVAWSSSEVDEWIMDRITASREERE